MNQTPKENTFTVDSIAVPSVKNQNFLPPIKTIESFELPDVTRKTYPQTSVQNNNQFYNNQQYIQFVYPEPYTDQLPVINPKKNDLKNTSKFVKIARKNYEQDRNLNYSLLQSKYVNRSYSENEEEEYIYLYKENSTPPRRNETPDTARIEIFNLNNQCNILKSENFFLNQKVYDLSMEIVRLQRLSMQFSQFREGLSTKQTETSSQELTYDVAQAKTRIMSSVDDDFNMLEFIDGTMTEFDKLE